MTGFGWVWVWFLLGVLGRRGGFRYWYLTLLHDTLYSTFGRVAFFILSIINTLLCRRKGKGERNQIIHIFFALLCPPEAEMISE